MNPARACGCRFARRIYVPLPDNATRAALLRTAMVDVATSITEAEYLALAAKCARYSGRDLVHICRWVGGLWRELRRVWEARQHDHCT